jgi:hypothetical protein
MTLATVAAEADALLPVETRTPPTDHIPRQREAEHHGPLAGTRGNTN